MRASFFICLALLTSCANQNSGANRAPSPVVKKQAAVASPSQSTVRLAWNPNRAAEQITAYNLYWKYYDGHQITPWKLKASVPATTSPTWSGVVPYGLYLFRVTAVSVFGESVVSGSIGYATQ